MLSLDVRGAAGSLHVLHTAHLTRPRWQTLGYCTIRLLTLPVKLLEVAFSLLAGSLRLLVDIILETVVNNECWLVHVEVCGCCSLWRICSLVIVRHLLLVEHLLTLTLQKAHMLLVDVLAIKFNVWITQTTRHLLGSATRLLGSRTSVA